MDSPCIRNCKAYRLSRKPALRRPLRLILFAGITELASSTHSVSQAARSGTPWPSDSEFLRVNTAIEDARSHHPEIASELVWALIWQESRYDPLALGTKGEVGLGQLMPATAQALGVRDRTDIDESVSAVAVGPAIRNPEQKL